MLLVCVYCDRQKCFELVSLWSTTVTTVLIQAVVCCLLSRKQRKPFYQLQSQPCGSGTSDTCTESRIQLVRIEICTYINNTRREHFDFPLSGRGIIVTVSVSIVDDHEPSILVIWQIRKKIGQCGNETKNQICSILFSIYSCTDWPQYPILVTHIHKASAICDKHMA